MPGIEAVPLPTVREAIGLLGGDPPGQRSAAQRTLREQLTAPGAVRALLDHAPEGARDAFARLAEQGPATVEDLLGRGWWGRGLLPPPLDWLQRRALVVVGGEGLVHAVDEVRDAWADLALPLAPPDPPDHPEPVRVEDVRAVVVAPTPQGLDRALAVPGARLRAVAPTVAVSDRTATVVRAALDEAGVPLEARDAVPAQPAAPALPGAVEEAVGPRAVRALVRRALDDGRQLRLQYFASSRGGQATERVVDPWSFADDLLRGWCHLREGERTFAIDRIGRARLLPSPLEHLPDAD